MPSVKFRGVNRADAFDELAHVDNVPAGLRQVAHTAIDQLDDSDVEVEFVWSTDASGVSAAVTVKVLGLPKRLPFTLTRDQIVEARNQGRSIPKD